MQLIKDLLSKLKRKEQKTDVPPGLIKEVEEASSIRSSRKRTTRLLLLTLLLVISGFATLFIVEYYLGTDLKKLAKIPMNTQTPIPQTPTAPQPPSTTEDKQQPSEDLKQQDKKTATLSQKPPKVTTPKVKPKRAITETPTQTTTSKQPVSKPETTPTEKIQETKPQKVIDTEKRDQYLYSARGYELRGAYQNAFNTYIMALELDPDNPVILNNLSGVSIQLGKLEQAIEYADKALKLRPFYISAMINKAIALTKVGQKTEAEQLLLQALSREPKNPIVLNNLAIFYESNHLFDRARQYYQTLHELGNPYGTYGLARIYERGNDIPSAIGLYRELLDSPQLDQKTKLTISDRLNSLLRQLTNSQ